MQFQLLCNSFKIKIADLKSNEDLYPYVGMILVW